MRGGGPKQEFQPGDKAGSAPPAADRWRFDTVAYTGRVPVSGAAGAFVREPVFSGEPSRWRKRDEASAGGGLRRCPQQHFYFF